MKFYSKSRSFFRVFLLLIFLLGFGGLGLWFLNSPSTSFQVKNPAMPSKDIPASSMQDPFSAFGGVTPQETVRLLVGALERGDLDLAGKYFSPQVREEETQGLSKLKDLGYLDQMILALKKIRPGQRIDSKHWKIVIPGENGQDSLAEVEFELNEFGFWKISSL